MGYFRGVCNFEQTVQAFCADLQVMTKVGGYVWVSPAVHRIVEGA